MYLMFLISLTTKVWNSVNGKRYLQDSSRACSVILWARALQVQIACVSRSLLSRYKESARAGMGRTKGGVMRGVSPDRCLGVTRALLRDFTRRDVRQQSRAQILLRCHSKKEKQSALMRRISARWSSTQRQSFMSLTSATFPGFTDSTEHFISHQSSYLLPVTPLNTVRARFL